MNRDDLLFLQKLINQSYENGLTALKNQQVKKAKRFFYSAAESTLLLAKDSPVEARKGLIARADELCALADAIEEKENEFYTEIPKEENAPPNKTKPPNEETSAEPAKIHSKPDSFTFNDVIGLEAVKNEIRRLAIYPQKYPEIYEQFKKKRGGGILLYGVPGTGKTMIANAIANELGAVFYPVKCSDILSKWFGEAEQNIRELFEEATKHRISVIFFDEFDALGTTRDTDSSSMKRIIPELLVGIQKAEESPNTLIVIAATNRPWDIDSAFLRPGRFRISVHIPLPDQEARKAMIDAILSDIPRAEDLDTEKIVSLSEGFSGADIAEVCERLKDCAIERIINKGEDAFITNCDIETVFQTARSSVKEEDLRNIEAYRNQNLS